MTHSRLGIAVHRLTRLFLGEPERRMTVEQIQAVLGLDETETRIIVETLKDAGLVVESAEGVVRCSVPAA